MDLKGKKILVVGLGESGYSAAVFLAEKGADVRVTEKGDPDAIMQKKKALIERGIKVETGGHSSEFCGGSELIVISPGISTGSSILDGIIDRGIPMIGEIELGAIFCKAPIIAVTGTNGKTTVVSLLGDIFKKAGKHAVVCGNIGFPLTSALKDIGPESTVILEVSSFQLETIYSFRPCVAAILNITEDHFERHGGMKNYRSAKFNIFSGQEKSDSAVVHESLAEDPLFEKVKSVKFIYGGTDSRYGCEKDRVIFNGGGYPETFIEEKDTSIKGRHNMENIACCAQIAEICGIDQVHVFEAAADFRAPEHRLTDLGRAGGILFIDDSKATNIDATQKALEACPDEIVLIAGGRDKKGDYGILSDIITRKVKAMVLLGEAAPKIRSIFDGKTVIYDAGDMDDAVRKAYEAALPAGTVLLSPMCSSFDMYKDHAHRGKVFRSSVEKIKQDIMSGYRCENEK